VNFQGGADCVCEYIFVAVFSQLLNKSSSCPYCNKTSSRHLIEQYLVTSSKSCEFIFVETLAIANKKLMIKTLTSKVTNLSRTIVMSGDLMDLMMLGALR